MHLLRKMRFNFEIPHKKNTAMQCIKLIDFIIFTFLDFSYWLITTLVKNKT